MGIPWTLRPCPVVHRVQACTRTCTGHAPKRRGCQPPAPTHSLDTALRIKGEEREEAGAFSWSRCRVRTLSHPAARGRARSLFGWLVADGWCWFVLREEYCWLVAGGWFVLREKYCWLVADKPSEQAVGSAESRAPPQPLPLPQPCSLRPPLPLLYVLHLFPRSCQSLRRRPFAWTGRASPVK
jgi:hypothetical protein